MRPLRPRSTTSDEHAAAVSRRLAALGAELAAARGDPPPARGDQQVRGLYAAPPIDPAAGPDRQSEGAPPGLPVSRIPMPGRHSARGPLVGRTSDLSSRLHLTSAHVAVIAVLVAMAVGVAAWLAVRSDPEPVPMLTPVDSHPSAPTVASMQSSPPLVGGTTGGAPGVGEGAPDTSAGLTVDVAGKVRRPGIAVLPSGARVVDALEAAGGARAGVDLTALNLARPLVDGEQILVGVPLPVGVTGTLGVGVGAPETGPLVNLNTADLATLETLPGVGPVTAAAIVSWRTQHGGFSAVEELLEVDGIGDATLAEIAPHVTI